METWKLKSTFSPQHSRLRSKGGIFCRFQTPYSRDPPGFSSCFPPPTFSRLLAGDISKLFQPQLSRMSSPVVRNKAAVQHNSAKAKKIKIMDSNHVSGYKCLVINQKSRNNKIMWFRSYRLEMYFSVHSVLWKANELPELTLENFSLIIEKWLACTIRQVKRHVAKTRCTKNEQGCFSKFLQIITVTDGSVRMMIDIRVRNRDSLIYSANFSTLQSPGHFCFSS